MIYEVQNLEVERTTIENAVIDNNYGPEIISELMKSVEWSYDNRGK